MDLPTTELVRPILYLIVSAESGEKGYEALWGGSYGRLLWEQAQEAVLDDVVALQEMSVLEVLEVQNEWLDLQRNDFSFADSSAIVSSAVGAYQFLNVTLQGLVDDGSVSSQDVFNKDTQDQAAISLLERRGLDGWLDDSDDDKFMKRLAQEWAGLPNPHTGASYYSGDDVNRAQVSVDDVRAALTEVRRMYRR